MDGDKDCLQKRFSSILKSGKVKCTDEDDRSEEIQTQRRVSFARKSAVKPFTHDAESNTIWDATYEEAAVTSDQSSSHTTADSDGYISVEGSNICPQKSSVKFNKTLFNMDEDIEIDTDDIHFAPVRQTLVHNQKFGIFIDDSLKLNAVVDLANRNSAINPLLLKENIKTVGKLVENQLESGENMQLENINSDKNNKAQSLISPDENNMNFTIHKANRKSIREKAEEGFEEEEEGMEFTKALPVKLLQKKPRKNRSKLNHANDSLDLTSTSPSAFPAKVSNEKLKRDIEDGDMEFTASIPEALLRKLRLQIAEDVILSEDIIEESTALSTQKFPNRDKENDMDIILNDNTRRLHKLVEHVDGKSDTDTDTDTCQNTHPTSEGDDTQYLVNFKSRFSEDSPKHQIENSAERNVFKPRSKNNSFFEPMEISSGTLCRTIREASPNRPVLTVNCHETDKIIFAAESVTSLQLDAPDEAYGISRRSTRGIAEENLVKTLKPIEKSLEKQIPDDSLECIINQCGDYNQVENLSKSRIILYDSNEESSDSALDSSLVNQKAVTRDAAISLSDLPAISAGDLPLEELFELLGWCGEKWAGFAVLPPLMTDAEKEKKMAERRECEREADVGMERLMRGCEEMFAVSDRIDRENAELEEEKVARMQGRTVGMVSVEEWIRQQRKSFSTLWFLETRTTNNYMVQSKGVEFHLEIDSETFLIKRVQNIVDSNIKLPIEKFIIKLILDKMKNEQINAAIGIKYNLRTYLEYLQLKLEEVDKIEREFHKQLNKLLVQAHIRFNDELILEYELIGRSRWLIQIDCSNVNKLSRNSILGITTSYGNSPVPEGQIKNIARKCPPGLPFLSSFIDAVYEFRNNYERQHCRTLNRLLEYTEKKNALL